MKNRWLALWLECNVIIRGPSWSYLKYNICKKYIFAVTIEHFSSHLIINKLNEYHAATKYKLLLLSECFHQGFLTWTLVSPAYKIDRCEAQVLSPSAVLSPVWEELEGGGRGWSAQLHNLLLNYVLKFLLKLVWWHRSIRPSLKSDERWESLCFAFPSERLLNPTTATRSTAVVGEI